MKKTWKLAGIAVCADFYHSFLESQCRLYESDEPAVLPVVVSQDDIQAERDKSIDGAVYPDGYYESLAFYRKLAVAALDFDVLLMHGSAIRYGDRGYIYTAPSGTGKSTHTQLCKELYGDKVSYINDDKPLLRRIDGKWYVYGTPWDGKHRRSENICAPLGGICQLERGEANSIQKIGYNDAVRVLMPQIYRPKDEESMKKVLSLMLALAGIPFWRLKCNISSEAAQLSLGAMGEIQ